MLGGACVWEGFWSLQQPSLCLQSRGALVQLLSCRWARPLLCSGPARGTGGRQSPLGMGAGGEGQDQGQLSLELHTPDCTAFGFTSPPLPAWQLGSAWTNASKNQKPFQPLMGDSEA